MPRRSTSTEVVDTKAEDNGSVHSGDQLSLFVEEELILREQIPAYILANRTTRPAIISTCTKLVKDKRQKSRERKPFSKTEIRALPAVRLDFWV